MIEMKFTSSTLLPSRVKLKLFSRITLRAALLGTFLMSASAVLIVAPATAADGADVGGADAGAGAGAGAGAVRTAPPHCFFVKASATSKSIPDLHHYKGQSGGHYVCPPSPNGTAPSPAASRGLFLFLPGTAPNYYKQVVETASAAGYHAIGLVWDDFPCVAVFCADKLHVAGKGNTNASAACAHNSEIMRFFGNKVGSPSESAVNVSPTNSVVGRLTALLRYLSMASNGNRGWSGPHHHTGGGSTDSRRSSSTDSSSSSRDSSSGSDSDDGWDGDGGWSQYLNQTVGSNSSTATAIVWSNLTLGGHSRGSDYPLMLSKRVAFKRGLYFGGPGQEFLGNCSNGAPSATNCNPAKGFGQAAWVAGIKSHVAAPRMYGLLAGYPGDACNMATPVWKLLGLPGAAAIDNATVSPRPWSALAAELAGARRLFDTSVCLHAPSPHMCMISEVYGPLDSHGRHKMIPIWNYMLTNDADATPAAVAREATTNCTMAVRPSY